MNLLVIFYISDTKYSFAYFTVKKAYEVIISDAVQLFKTFIFISFCLNSTVEPYNIIAKFGTFFMRHPVIIIIIPGVQDNVYGAVSLTYSPRESSSDECLSLIHI